MSPPNVSEVSQSLPAPLGSLQLTGGDCASSASCSADSDVNCAGVQPATETGMSLDKNAKIIGHKSICLVKNNVNLLNLNSTLNNMPVTAIIDSGSVSSLISYDLALKLNFDILPHDDERKGFGNDPFRIIGIVNCENFKINDVLMNKLQLLVYPSNCNPSGDLFLGCDFLTNNAITLCVRDKVLIKNFEDGSNVKFYLDPSGSVSNVLCSEVNCYASEDVTIPPSTPISVSIEFCLPSVCPDQMLLYSDDGVDGKLSDSLRGLSGVVSERTKSILLVSSDGPSHVKKGQVVGKISSISELPDVSDEVCPENDEGDPLSQVNLCDLSVQEQSKVLAMLNGVKSVFSTNEYDIGHANVTEHVIRLSDETPIYQRPRRFPPPVANEIERQCMELQALDIIEPSVSPWNSPIVPIVKKGGGVRLCLDYRKLNKVTIPDRHPVPNLSDSIFGLHGTKFFTRLDLVKSYYQIPIDENSKPYTAFSTPKNHWQFKRLSFGLRNAPSAFQREIQAVLSSFPSNKVIAYIDDILIMSSSFSEHLELVQRVLHTLVSYKLKVKPVKCEFFKSEVEFLGHVINRTGIRKTPEYIEKVAQYPRPKTKGELREFLGFINFQRKYLPNCSVIQKPLSCHTSGPKRRLIEWTEEMNDAFDKLKLEMKNEIELAYPDYSEGAQPLELWVDASNFGAGAYLAQTQGNVHRVIGFASMSFDGPKLNYSTLERELCALRWGVKTFKPFLYGVNFVLYTDHQPLVHLNNMKIVCARLARTVEELADFNFEIRYVAGHLNTAADALSRVSANSFKNDVVYNSSLPDGLVIDESCIPGGGDSMVLSLHRCLSRLVHQRHLPGTGQELRELLVDEVFRNADLYKLTLNRESRRQLRLMRHRGQLPSFDLLMAASRLFELKIHVYFWPSSPIIFQFEDFKNDRVISLQCVSGIHFNPLIGLCNYVPPDPRKCSINSVQSLERIKGCEKEVSDELDLVEDSAIVFVEGDNVNDCSHSGCQLPQVTAFFPNLKLCAVLDSAAEISLLSESALKLISSNFPVDINNGFVCNAIGFSGDTHIIDRTVELTFMIGSFDMPKPFKFAIVNDNLIPCCLLLGLDFMFSFNVHLNYSKRIVLINNHYACKFFLCGKSCSNHDVLMVSTQSSTSHVLKIEAVKDEFRFEIEGNPHLMSGLSLVGDVRTAKLMQRGCPQLRQLHSCLSRQVEAKNWSSNLKVYVRHAPNLIICEGIIGYGLEEPTMLVSHKFLTGVALVLHNEYAHVGRDKLRYLIRKIFWHPSLYNVCSDVCTSCQKCQITKEYSTVVCPPTLKIQSSYPFELVAIDLVSLPKTAGGFIGCLMVVDHFSKWAAAVRIRDKKSSTVVSALKFQVFPFMPRVPAIILSDNGPEFTSQEFDSLMDAFSIKHKLTTPYQPTSNGCVERVNQSIKNLIRSVTDSGSTWDQSLPRAVISYNNTVHTDLKMTPAEFLMVKTHPLELNVLPEMVNEMWKEGHPNFSPFKVGQLVLVKINLKGFLNTNKLSENFDGPCRVTQVNSNGVTYQVKHVTTHTVTRVHHTKLKPYRAPPPYLQGHPYFSKYYPKGLPDIPIRQAQPQYGKAVPVSSVPSHSCPSADSESSDSPSSLDAQVLPSADRMQMSQGIPAFVNPSSGGLGCCRGCEFESSRELATDDTHLSPAPNEVEYFDSEIGPGGPHVAKYRNLLDWTDSDSDSFEIPSIDSRGMEDFSADDISHECKNVLEDVPPVRGNLLVEDGNPSLVVPCDNTNDFTGFDPDDDSVSKGRRGTIQKIIQWEDSGIEIGMNLRSGGPVEDLPNVQTFTLERKKRGKKTY